jgi:hypothetical protein
MKHENSILPQDDNEFFSNFPDLQNELMQLRKVNEFAAFTVLQYDSALF